MSSALSSATSKSGIHPVTRANLVLAVLVAVLASLLSWQHGAGQPPPLTDIDPAGVKAVDIYLNGKLHGALLRDAEGWQLTHPEIGRADSAKVQRLLSVTATPSLRRFPPLAGELAPYGLKAPGSSISLDGRRIDFGGLDPSTQLRFVGYGGQVHLTNDAYLHLLQSAPALLLQTPD